MFDVFNFVHNLYYVRLMRMIFDVKIVLRFRLFAVPASTLSASSFSSRTCSDIDGGGSDGFPGGNSNGR